MQGMFHALGGIRSGFIPFYTICIIMQRCLCHFEGDGDVITHADS